MPATRRHPDDHPGPGTPAGAAALRAELAAAFAARPRPDDEAAFQRPDDPECAWLRDRTWRQLLDADPDHAQGQSVHGLTPQGWVYYFPALASLALDVEHPAELDDALLVKLAWRAHEVKPLLTPRERRAVVRFLEHLSAAYDERGWQNLPRYALDFHWGRDSATADRDGDGPSDTEHQEDGDALS